MTTTYYTGTGPDDENLNIIHPRTLDVLANGTVNFSVASYDTRHVRDLATANITVQVGDPNKAGAFGYTDDTPFTDPDGNAATVFTYPDRLKSSSGWFQYWENQIGNIVHEVAHTNENLDDYRAQLVEDMSAWDYRLHRIVLSG